MLTSQSHSPLVVTGLTISHYRILEKVGPGTRGLLYDSADIRFHVLTKVGSDGRGVVYRAEDTRHHGIVALKFLANGLRHDQAALEGFRSELHTVSALNHPNICKVYEVDEYRGQVLIAMEFLNGKVLKDYIAGNPLPLGQVLNVGIELADGLSASHARGIVHRDIKPANVFVTDSGHAKILNFGLAQLTAKSQMDQTGTTDAIADVSGDQLTLPWTANATVAYMSPERVRGEELDGRTDLFSLGLVLYEMATGQRPFRGATPGVVTDAILHYAPTPVRQVIPNAPAQLEQIVGKALEKDCNLRYQKASDIRADLEALMNKTH